MLWPPMTLFGNNAVDTTQPSETPPAIYLKEDISFMIHRLRFETTYKIVLTDSG